MNLADSEIAVWENGKVLKLYPKYLDKDAWEYLAKTLRALKNPILKLRQIYSRDNEIIRSNKLIDDIVDSMYKMSVLT